MKKKFDAVYIIILMLLAWIVASYFNVITHNMSDCKYASWNLFVLGLKCAAVLIGGA